MILRRLVALFFRPYGAVARPATAAARRREIERLQQLGLSRGQARRAVPLPPSR